MLAIERTKSTLQKNMEKILSDLKTLQREEEILIAENKKKKESIDVNLNFIENWLEKTKELREYHESSQEQKPYFFQRTSQSEDERGWAFLYSRHGGNKKSQRIVKNIDNTRIIGDYNREVNHILHNTPSLSFIQYVECTFNLFTQLTERVKELEKKIENITSSKPFT